ncbi:Fe-S cluster domain-containing protein, partial [human gut metagenome]
GPLTVENPYVAKARIQHLRKYMPVSCNHLEIKTVPRYMRWDNPLKELPVMRLSDDMGEALQKMGEMKKIESSLPGLDCGTCGAPSCSDLAEDIVRGKASIEDCVFFSRENTDKNNYIPIPAPFRKTEKNE